MPQLHTYIPDDIAATLKERAKARNISVSKYLAELVERDIDSGWPDGYFEDTIGSWKGEPLVRPEQPRHEDPDAL